MALHADNQTVIRERIWLDKSDKDLLHNRVTIEDHALTRPWTIERTYKRDPNPVWDFVDCAENNPHVLVGKEYYMISADGYLMPTKEGPARRRTRAISAGPPPGGSETPEARVFGQPSGLSDNQSNGLREDNKRAPRAKARAASTMLTRSLVESISR